MRARAFTLIELLVTLGIIAVLAAIMFPVYVQVKTKVHQYSASSGARQIGMALGIYVNDHDGYFPQPNSAWPGDSLDWNEDGTVEWYEQLGLYIGDRRAFRVHHDLSNPAKTPCSFASNSWFDYGFHESKLSDSSSTIYITERADMYERYFLEWWNWQSGVWPPNPNAVPTESARREAAIERYNGFCNYLYVDGHVRGRKFDQTWSPKVEWWPEAPPDPPSGR
jgi:prepilin-type N-terminal cleavage/methylation domain-containing protein/prepilin-type processing-associated H-X9-DG protein